ncbi:MAG: M23 family metallopeptidase [Deltaproteobacteria bacterium]|nr:M23 family metallopeptidase [Deltaproteobacteria bacterium]
MREALARALASALASATVGPVTPPTATPGSPPAPAAALALRLSPGTARPGDLLLVTVPVKKAPAEGRIGDKALRFFRTPAGHRALAGLAVDAEPGEQPLAVALADGTELAGALQVLPPAFRERVLGVSKRFTSPNAAAKRKMKEDDRAFNRAYGQAWGPPLFTRNFQWPRATEITAPFGDRRVYNGKLKSQHMGTDLDGRTGDPVQAANDGMVVMARECFSTGNTVILHHGAGLYTAYFHFSRTDVAEGQQVKRGELLGAVGMTGRVTGPHLHWAVKLEGKYVDPESLLRLDFER